jgi:probable dihydroxyacetone kinase regulator
MRNNLTKKHIAEGLKALSGKKRLEKVTVADIISECDISRGTFYYHFKDVDDVIRWIFKSEVVDFCHEAVAKIWSENVYYIFDIFFRDGGFYRQAIQIVGFNNLKQYIYELNYGAFVNIIDSYEKGVLLEPEEKRVIAEFYTDAFVEMYEHYIKEENKIEPKKMVQYCFDLTEPNIFHSVDLFLKRHDKDFQFEIYKKEKNS